MLDGRVLGASQVEYKPCGNPPLKREIQHKCHLCSRHLPGTEASLPRHLPGIGALPSPRSELFHRGRDSVGRGRFSDFALASGVGFHPEKPITGPAPKVRQRCCPRSIADGVLFFTTYTPCCQSCCGNRIALVNPAVATGLPLSILLWQQDCSTQSCCGNRIALVNPAVATGLPLSILLWQQDCSPHSCAGNRIAPVHYEQLGLGTVLARAQACDGVGPAVELPGLGHVVDAQDEGQSSV